MPAPIVALAQRVTDLLNTPSAFTPALGATREYQPFYELPAAAVPRVSVYGTSDKTLERDDRAAWKHELVVEIAVQRKLDSDADTEKDALVDTADAICEYIKTHWPEGDEADLIDATLHSLVQSELLKINRLFTSLVRLTFWHTR